MPKQKSNVPRAEYKKEWRRKNREDKRFNKPLNKYLKLKYGDIYDEYCTFFKTLDEENPTTKDLTKTTTFKKWEQQLNENDSADEFNEPTIKLNTYYLNGPEAETVTAVIQEEISRETIQDDDDEGNNETIQDDEGNNMEQQADNIIEQIINEVEIDQAVHEILNAMGDEPQHEDLVDEGIGLNLEDEIVDPFDFNLEIGLDY